MPGSGVDEGFEDRTSWSPREREHQLSRFRRKRRLARTDELTQTRQPNFIVSVRQPEKITLQPWPSLPGVRAWLQYTCQAWRVLTSGGDHSESYLRRVEDGAKVKTDTEFAVVLESLKCEIPEYLTAEEKLSLELTLRFPEYLQRELSLMREQRRQEGLPSLIGRQLLAWGLRKYCRDEIRDKNTARSAMSSLRDSVAKSAPGRQQFRRLLQAIESNLVWKALKT